MTPHTTRRILVVDDELSMVRALARLLQRDGYVVATARNGRQALAAIQGQHFDVILCDLRMPKLDGRAFYAHVRQQAPALCQRVIFLTGDSSAADHQEFLAQCGRPWLEKPCPIAVLRKAIQQVVERTTRAPQRSRTYQGLRQRRQTLAGSGPTVRAPRGRVRRQAARRRGEVRSTDQPRAS